MSFLSIPSQEGLFTAIKTGRSADRFPLYDEDNDEDDEEEDEDDDPEGVRFIPRCSPVPRKRGASIHDETAEYMRIHQALSAIKKVSFADTTGGELVDVKEFVAFDSDDDETSARWEEEEAKYRHAAREPTRRVQPEFLAPAGGALLRSVRANKVEVEQLCPVEDEPLAFSGLIRVLNVSFHKAVYIRSTMDRWLTYFDHPAEYVQGSHDGATDRFSFKLSFAPPYTAHGSRIEFVVRYETSEGDFWANNCSMNYVVTLLLSYEEDSARTDVDEQQTRSILKPSKVYSMNDEDFDSEDEREKEEGGAGTSHTGLETPAAACPLIVQPEIDIEQIAVPPSGPSVPPDHELSAALTASPGEPLRPTSSQTTLQTNSPFVLCASESVRTNESRPLPRLHCESHTQTSDACPSPPLPPPHQESGPSSDDSRAGGEEVPPEASSTPLPATETSLCPTGDDRRAERPASPRRPEPAAAARVSATSAEPEVAAGRRELAAASSDGSTGSPGAETQTSQLGAGGEASPSPALTEARHNSDDEAAHFSPDTSLENLSTDSSEANRNLMSSVVFLSGVVSLSVVMQEPSALFLIGLLLVLHRL
ncbi:uncharacterized protein si:ch211-167b20.8 isoform X3 [Scophthalmus maximus]|uniref:uncharacterized protein si:ch211-167b20.8 isoform X3 n=1 Tax=Scophthalmus maximus TaxID=52904 RepID=UPI001FA8D78E|nr:uncharacterized protein si:ch211-167b20.8 isoform X3 [Scophthalmus maximus]